MPSRPANLLRGWKLDTGLVPKHFDLLVTLAVFAVGLVTLLRVRSAG